MKRNSRKRERGVTLIEILIVTAIIALVSGAALWGPGTFSSVKLQRSAVMITSAIRVAASHATATAKVVRLAFDFDERSITLEESTQLEQQALDETQKIFKGPPPARPAFRAAKAFGFDPDGGKKGKVLGEKVRFLQIETAHDDLPLVSRRGYLYFWPGGATERAGIQIGVGDGLDDRTNLTILVQPLTGKADIKKGRVAMLRPRDDAEESEVRDGF